MKFAGIMTGVACVGVVLLAAPAAVHAQRKPEDARITLDLRDADIRTALKQIFDQAGVDYGLDPQVQGYITLKLTDQTFDIALRQILRASQIPLTFTRENGIYNVRPRPVSDPSAIASAAPPPVNPNENTQTYAKFEQIPLQFADPMDLAGIFGITILPTNIRGMGGGMGGGMMGGMGGFGGGMMGGGMMGGGLGGGMMGGMGGMMGGGMGGFGGGMGGFGGGMMGGGMGGFGGGMMGGGMGGFGGGMGGFGGGGFGGGRGF